MVVDVADVRDIGMEVANHGTQPMPCPPRIDGVCGQVGTFENALGFTLEVDVGGEVLLVSRRLSACAGHGKKGRRVSMLEHQLHEIEQVHLGAAEAKVIFVAIQDSHEGNTPVKS